MNAYDDCLDCSDDDDIGLLYRSSYLLSSDSEKDDLDESVFNGKAGIESEDDEFEKDMAKELSMTMSSLTAPLLQASSGSEKPSSSKKVSFSDNILEDGPQFYDEVYFDSDSSNEELETRPTKPKKTRTKHRMLSNDELFYDPDMDDEDQAWIDKKRKSYQVKRKKRTPGKSTAQDKMADKLPRTDAVLNCPACLTTLCLDSQRHEIYNNQYRAMFVFHCKIDFTERLRFPSKNKNNFMKNKKLRAKQRKKMLKENANNDITEGNDSLNTTENQKDVQDNQSNVSTSIDDTKCDSPSIGSNEIEQNSNFSAMETEKIEGTTSGTAANDEYFNSVACDVCNTKVAVYDKDEVYHFFNIVTSY